MPTRTTETPCMPTRTTERPCLPEVDQACVDELRDPVRQLVRYHVRPATQGVQVTR